jgi:hypothetical protein
MKVVATLAVVALVASALYSTWLDVQTVIGSPEKKMRGPQPLLGATYYKQNQKK